MKTCVAAAVVVLALPGVALAEGPSFDCRTARSPREIVVCADDGLAKADRDLAGVYATVRRRLPAPLAVMLAGDQRAFLGDLDDGFAGDFWGKAGPPDDGRRMREELRLAPHDRREAIDRLRGQIEERTRFLARVVADRAGFGGRWEKHGTTLTITRTDGGWQLVYQHPSYGWPKYGCRFTATARTVGEVLVVEHVENVDADGPRPARLIFRREGPVLSAEEEPREDEGRSACVRAGPVDGTFFAVSR